MSELEKFIDVEAPVRAAYELWARFGDSPRFMEGVTDVRPLGANVWNWNATFGKKNVEWTSEVISQEIDRRISWIGRNGPWTAGSVRFQALGPERTRVTLQLDYDPQG